MAEKISILIVVVDLDCHKCYHKIRKILCMLQDHERIRTISFDNKSKTITIVGPFDPQRLACKLRCKGGNVIKDLHIVDTNGGGGKRPPEKPPRAELELPMSPPPKEMPPMKLMDMAMPVPQHQPLQLMPACPGRPLEQPVAEYVIPTVEIPSWPEPPVGPCGCPWCAPCHQGVRGSRWGSERSTPGEGLHNPPKWRVPMASCSI
ncbi:unnamed protein product [Miscanthus lutarioriparius]|uniref:HMA domain-containing protein n=1 Tax=Miscanthus lutarioriparius TaxID=422564 RepID=A0A811Q1Z4_9POAL|nr:unnamed protein product [Miscanthus lutarioriparius]